MKTLKKAQPHDAPVQAARPQSGIWGITGWWRRLYGYYQRLRSLRRGRKALMSLDTARLRDIGLTRDDLPYKDERR
ncbi:DUF1127 domain-containing protein [Acerihabitans sp.]|uniref:DUF1127 domain-containing protein n=1 Tax=Acerihabitans sp. TaxID=2811394 RepID=UPI002ED7C4D6